MRSLLVELEQRQMSWRVFLEGTLCERKKRKSFAPTNRQRIGWMDGWMDSEMDGRIDGRMSEFVPQAHRVKQQQNGLGAVQCGEAKRCDVIRCKVIALPRDSPLSESLCKFAQNF